ncbi:PhzF family phenazine biosynthesis protein [Clostridium pasteurianum]|uniref:Phenazine biosynthesis protein PhzF family n=1 Tax=Clostridium pasteurianum BC1 TaxID=86416 RepID=R4JY83_CLOPA|nr:PhzF family phenazine biosynthesis protein [Clostridium pasteurianum]AGK95777.1 phenazine biosynthesis protein PhzF family [Clostridium pasteurianum BC1]
MIDIYQVDSFTTERFKGNPACVCVLDKFPDSKNMLNMAREMNLSETAFVVRDKDEFTLRWFTPTFEIDLCGHATLATAHILWTEGFWDKNKPIIFNTRSGKLIINLINDFIEMDFPSLEYSEVIEVPNSLIEGLGGIIPTFMGKSRENYLIEVATEEEVRDIQIDISKLLECNMHGVIVTAKGSEEYDFVSRFFAPEVGVPEDPVTGSAHCVLAPFWNDRLGNTKFRAYQCSQRGGYVNLELLEDRILLRGNAVTIFKGKLLEQL